MINSRWLLLLPIGIDFQAVDNNNNYYYAYTEISVGDSSTGIVIPVDGFYNLTAVNIYYIYNPSPSDVEIIECSTCGRAPFIYYDTNYQVVQPGAVTSSVFSAQVLNISSSAYGIKVSSSVDGQFANCDAGIKWSGNNPVYFTGSY